MDDPRDDGALAVEAAGRAARVLLELRARGELRGAALGAAADRRANDAIARLLRRERPDDALLSEEMAPDPSRLARSRVWIVDPLDGTREYVEPGRDDWAVHVALTVDGVPATCVVALPARGEVWRSAAPAPLPKPASSRLRIVVSRTRAPALARRVAASLDAELVPMGSAGAKTAALLRGEAQAYLHAGGMNEWDACAPVGVALAHGLHASRLDGSPCRFNQPNTAMPDLLICRREWLPVLRGAIDAAPR